MTGQLTISPIGGLANRMRAILAADAMCRAIGSQLHVIWLRENGLQAQYNQLFEPLPLADVEECRGMKAFVHRPPLKRNLYLPRLFQVANYDLCLFDWQLCELQKNPDKLAEKCTGKRVFIASGQGFYPADDSAFKTCFCPLPELTAQARQRARQWGEYTVGVHIRRTDNAVAINESPVELFVERMKEFTDATFYLATDDEKVKAQLRLAFGDRIHCSTSRADRTTLEGMQEAVVEMFTLVRTDYFLGTYYSSFSDIVLEMCGHGEIIRKK